MTRLKAFSDQAEPLDRKWFEWSRLNRMYVFQKVH